MSPAMIPSLGNQSFYLQVATMTKTCRYEDWSADVIFIECNTWMKDLRLVDFIFSDNI
jgi:hypothetical protein